MSKEIREVDFAYSRISVLEDDDGEGSKEKEDL